MSELQKPYFSIIMASFLGNYSTAAKNRHQKIHRAIKSVIDQSFQDWELLVIADGCKETFEIMKGYTDRRINCSLIEKQKHLSGKVRNRGIVDAEGEYILYLDIDDYFGEGYLQKLFNEIQITKSDWYYFNDLIWSKTKWTERIVHIQSRGHHGTSNICHAKEMNALWETDGYLHDHHFVQQLLKKSKGAKIKTPGYFVCHIPGSRGYDI